MTYKPPKPEPPVPTESVTLFGVHDAARRLGFLVAYFGMCALTVRSCTGCMLWQLALLHAWWFVGACYFAQQLNGWLCELADESAHADYLKSQQAYARELLEAMSKQPLLRIERNPETDTLEDVRQPLRERPLIDKEMGVRIRT